MQVYNQAQQNVEPVVSSSGLCFDKLDATYTHVIIREVQTV